jgi:uncharacterized membrane protein
MHEALLIFALIGCTITQNPRPPQEEPPMNEPTMGQAPMSSDVTSDDKLWALLAYILTPIVPVIILLMEDKKNRPFIRAHNAQALVVGIVNIILGVVLSFTLILACVPLLVWFVCIYWGIQAYNGKYVEIPVISNFVKNQGWA